jgi:hypothetical protein
MYRNCVQKDPLPAWSLSVRTAKKQSSGSAHPAQSTPNAECFASILFRLEQVDTR